MKALLCVAFATAKWNARLASCDRVRRRRRRLGGDRRAHPLEIGLGAPRCREARDLGLEAEPRFEPLTHVVEPCLGDEEPAVDLEVDEPVSREPAERLADRAAGDTERVGELALPRREPGARVPATISERISSYASPTTDRTRSGRAGWGSSSESRNS